jgi:hypothetical protein
VQAGNVHSAGELLPGPTGRTSSYDPTAANQGAATSSGLGEMPVVSTGDMAAASTYGAQGTAVAVAAPNAYYVGGGTRATAAGDSTGLYGGTRSAAYNWWAGGGGGGREAGGGRRLDGAAAPPQRAPNRAPPAHRAPDPPTQAVHRERRRHDQRAPLAARRELRPRA